MTDEAAGPPLSAPGPISSQVFQPPPPNNSLYQTRKKKKVHQTAPVAFFSPPSQSDAYSSTIQNDHLSKSDKQRKSITPDQNLNQKSNHVQPSILQFNQSAPFNSGGEPPLYDSESHQEKNEQYDPPYGDFPAQEQYNSEGMTQKDDFLPLEQFDQQWQPQYGEFTAQDQYAQDLQPPFIVSQEQFDPEGQTQYDDFAPNEQYVLEGQQKYGDYVPQEQFIPEKQQHYGDFTAQDHVDPEGQPTYGEFVPYDQYEPERQAQYEDFAPQVLSGEEGQYGAGLAINFSHQNGVYPEKRTETVSLDYQIPPKTLDKASNAKPAQDEEIYQHSNLQHPQSTGGCIIHEKDINSSLYLSYDWVIPSFPSLRNSEEKIVSPPFGSKDKFYQLVLYPCGASEGAGTHVSVFLKPIKSLIEEKDGRDWWRPVSQFSIHAFGSSDSPIGTESSDPNDFEGFNAATSAWGFAKFLPFETVDFSLNASDSVTLQVEVYWSETDILGSIFFTVEIPPVISQAEVFGPFGIDSVNWNLIARNISEKGETFLSIFLELFPQNQGIRKIASLKAKLLSGGSIFSKTLTGGLTFSSVETSYGWENFLSLSEINNAETCSLEIQIDYVKSSLIDVSHEANESESLKREIATIQESKAAVLSTLKKKETELLNLQKSKVSSIAKLEDLVNSLKNELNDAHSAVKNELESNKKILYLKSNLVALLEKMNSDNLSAKSLPPDVQDLMQELQAYMLKNSQLESELVAVKSELEMKKIEFTELKVFQAIQDVDSVDFNDEIPTSLPDAMDKVRDEIVETNIAIEEAKFKIPPSQSQDTHADCATISADLVVRLAELEVSRANLLSNIPHNSVQESPDLSILRNDLFEARRTLFSIIRDLDFDGSFWQHDGCSYDPPHVEAVNFTAMSPLKLDGTNDGFGILQYQNTVSNVSPEIHASQAIAENVSEMKSVLDQFKQIILAEPSRRESMMTLGSKSQKEEQNLIQAIPATVEKWDPPLKQNVVPWSARRKDSSNSFGFAILIVTIFVSTIFFLLYASVFVLCSQDLSKRGSSAPSFVKSPKVRFVCSTFVLPAWEKMSDIGHSNIEYLVLDFFPNIYLKASHGTELFLKFNEKSFEAIKKNIFSTQDRTVTTDISRSEQFTTTETYSFKNRRSQSRKDSQESEKSAETVNVDSSLSYTNLNLETGDKLSENPVGSLYDLDLSGPKSEDLQIFDDENDLSSKTIKSDAVNLDASTDDSNINPTLISEADPSKDTVSSSSSEDDTFSDTESPSASVSKSDDIHEEDFIPSNISDELEESEHSKDDLTDLDSEELKIQSVDADGVATSDYIPDEEQNSVSILQDTQSETLSIENMEASHIISQDDEGDFTHGFDYD